MPRLVGTATSIKFWEMVEAKARMVICSIQYGERSGNDVAALHSEGLADLKSNIGMAELTTNHDIKLDNESEPNLLIISSEVLECLKNGLVANHVKPTPGTLRVVMAIIERSLPDDGVELFI
ncbi:hypothetical protein CFHODIGL_00034 [Edwardsiella phage EPP-1]|uniref:hypothetical protein n=1 Tax=Edwardsiella piscicida TaxID=1263550 RepID=UPI001F32856C|nr:hypothetical protein [Edwardsiella piscicida]UJT80173.1 hypothetical protein L1P06_06365 [Edwardsiella piscicida]WJN66849.1 hypothetical protein CFHODIGL_00034 [Edwardsiella phage EPP-1]